MSFEPLVSVLVPTKNVASMIERLMRSVYAQTYTNWELLVVDNYSTDLTQVVVERVAAEAPGKRVEYHQKGPERHAQRPEAVRLSAGEIIVFVDADMRLEPELLSQIVERMQDKTVGAVIIPEKPVGAPSFWTEAKMMERAMYAGDDSIEAARAFRREVYDQVGGFDPEMVSCEDWDLTQRTRREGVKIVRTEARLVHDEGDVRLGELWKKKAYYGGKAVTYTGKRGILGMLSKIYFFRPSLWKSMPENLKRPRVLAGMLWLLGVELLAGAYGYLCKRRT